MSQSNENDDDLNGETFETLFETPQDLDERGSTPAATSPSSITSPNPIGHHRKREAADSLIEDLPKEKKASFSNCSFTGSIDQSTLMLILKSGGHFQDCKF